MRFDPDERVELDALITEAFGNGGTTAEKGARFERLLFDAEQAQRMWASRVLDECRRQGLIAYGRREFQRLNTVPVSYNGKVLSMPLAMSRRQRTETGEVVQELRLIEFWTWDEVIAKARDIGKVIEGYSATLEGLMRLLALRELFPESTGPAQACLLAGTTIEVIVSEAAV